MVVPAELCKCLRALCLLLHFVFMGSGLQLHTPICLLNKGPSPQAVGSPELDPQRVARAPGSARDQTAVSEHPTGSDTKFHSHIILCSVSAIPAVLGGDKGLGQPLCLGFHLA